MNTFRDHNRPSLYPPTQNCLRRGDIFLQAQFSPETVRQDRTQLRVSLIVSRIRIRQRRVRNDLDTVLDMPLHELLLLQVRMRLKLVRIRLDLRVLQQLIQLSRAEVRHADMPCQIGAHQVFHRAPRVPDAGILVQHIPPRGLARQERHRPMHQI